MSISSMSVQDKKCIFLANWSAYPTLDATYMMLDKLIIDAEADTSSYYIALPFSTCISAIEKYKDSPLILGTDAMLSSDEGSFTEPIATQFLIKYKIPFVLINAFGHKNSTDVSQNISKKVQDLLQNNIIPFICFGETLQDHENNNSRAILSSLLNNLLKDISPHLLININLVYEAPWIDQLPYKPDWEQVAKSYQLCRDILQEVAGIQLGNEISLICCFPYDFDDLHSLKNQSNINGFYFSKAGLNQNKIYELLAHYKEKKEMPKDNILFEKKTDTQPSIAIEKPKEEKTENNT